MRANLHVPEGMHLAALTRQRPGSGRHRQRCWQTHHVRIVKEAPTPDRYDSRAQARTATTRHVADVAALVPSYESMLLFGRARSMEEATSKARRPRGPSRPCSALHINAAPSLHVSDFGIDVLHELFGCVVHL